MSTTIARRMAGYATSEDGHILPTASLWERIEPGRGVVDHFAINIHGLYPCDETGHILHAAALALRHVGLSQVEELHQLGWEVIE